MEEAQDQQNNYKTVKLNISTFAVKLRLSSLNSLFRARGSNSEGHQAYLAYISEGVGKLQDWEMVMKFQRKNGSLFNSPSATAAAFTNIKNDGCLKYLCSVVEKFGNAGSSLLTIT